MSYNELFTAKVCLNDELLYNIRVVFLNRFDTFKLSFFVLLSLNIKFFIMVMLTENEIKAADAILNYATMDGVSKTNIWNFNKKNGITEIDIIHAAAHLDEHRFITIFKRVNEPMYKLESKGLTFARSGKSYVDHLKEETERIAKQGEKDNLDWQHKLKQIEELEIKLKTLEIMQIKQQEFWESGINRDYRQKWQFIWTFMIAAAGFLLSIFNFVRNTM